MPPRPSLVLATCCLSLVLVGLDVTIVNVALPAIRSGLGAGVTGLQWVMDAYTLAVASLMLLTGSMADRFGRRRVFRVGLVLFTLASVLCSLAPGIGALIACRLLQGVGASMLNPVALSIIAASFPAPAARARAIGTWGAVLGISLGLGPVLGGALTEAFGWRWIFLVNLPVGLAALALTAWYVPESRAARPRAPDPVGQLLVTAGLGCLAGALIEGQRLGWASWPILLLLAVSGLSLAGLVFYERRRAEPLVELRFFASVPFTGAALIALAAFGCFAGLLFLGTLYLQQVRGLPALQAGLCTLPLASMTLVCGPLSGRMVARFGTRLSLLLAGAGLLSGALVLTRLTADSPLALLLSGYALFGAGIGLVNPPVSTVAMAGLPPGQAGMAAAMASTSRQFGATLGVALAGAAVARQGGLAQAALPVWWGMAACGAAIMALGWITNTPWARRSAQRVAATLEDRQAVPP